MDNLQYVKGSTRKVEFGLSFKPYYKWIIFNICIAPLNNWNVKFQVLNLIING